MKQIIFKSTFQILKKNLMKKKKIEKEKYQILLNRLSEVSNRKAEISSIDQTIKKETTDRQNDNLLIKQQINIL